MTTAKEAREALIRCVRAYGDRAAEHGRSIWANRVVGDAVDAYTIAVERETEARVRAEIAAELRAHADELLQAVSECLAEPRSRRTHAGQVEAGSSMAQACLRIADRL